MLKHLLAVPLLLALLFSNPAPATANTSPPGASPTLPEPAVLRQWIAAMKEAPRGPFTRLRWFCKDGQVLPPDPYACSQFGGGVQHGEWTDQVKRLRANGYLVATLLADLSAESFYAQPDWLPQLKQILLEQYLIAADDGWILRKARYYRGGLQAEDENRQGRDLLTGLLRQPQLTGRHYLLLREAARLLPHGQDSAPLTEMRQLAQRIDEADPSFTSLRIKLHSRPEAADAAQVRAFAKRARPALQEPLQQLAELIEILTHPAREPFAEALKLGLAQPAKTTEPPPADWSAELRFARASQLLLRSRSELGKQRQNSRKLAWLDLSIPLELEVYRSANQLLDQLPTSSRRQRLEWIALGFDAVYGTGLLSERERQSLKESLQRLQDTPLSLNEYQRELLQLARASRWAENRLRYHFDASIGHLAQLDPAFNSYLQERLRSSPLLPVTQLIDSLLADGRALRGVRHSLFGADADGLRPLNPGLARGRLELVDNPLQHSFSREGIYLLPETVEDLPPVAGILTRGEGNALSHVQLLARNLGIPNIAVDEGLLPTLAAQAGQQIAVAVSPGGVVRIEIAGDSAEDVALQEPEFLIDPDLEKLYLDVTAIHNLKQLQASDSGRIAGPKGANLGELKLLYDELVPDALLIPFGRFNQLLQQPSPQDDLPLQEWMRANYYRLGRIADPQEQQQQTGEFLAELRRQIEAAPLDPAFIAELRAALQQEFGADGSYGVFVRSDTNVEDLPNFTGAGLNLTVPHVVGFDNILTAIRRVWASPFTERAFGWRQAHMRAPEQLYASVLLMKSVPAEKSGVLATADLLTGQPRQLHVAVNEGVGGAVSGERAEELLIDRDSGQVRLLAQSSADRRRVLLPGGGVKKVAADAPERLLTDAEIAILRQMAEQLPQRFPALRGENGQSLPADIEFGFLKGRFVLFQIRPLLENARVKTDLQLLQLDAGLRSGEQAVDLNEVPGGRR